MFPGPGNKVYLDVEEDTIHVYPVKTTESREEEQPQAQNILTDNWVTSGRGKYYFYNTSFDFDMLNTPLEYRFLAASPSRQLTTHFDRTVYVGFRNNIFRIRYEQTPLNKVERNLSLWSQYRWFCRNRLRGD